MTGQVSHASPDPHPKIEACDIVGPLMSAPDQSSHPVITSPSNHRVKWLVSLRKRPVRDAEGLMIVEGYDELRLALDAGVRPHALFYCPSLVNDPGRVRLAQELAAQGTAGFELGAAAFSKASVREAPDGWLAVVPTPVQTLDALRLSDHPLLLVCEAVEKPGNLGAMLRTAEAAGVDAVIAADPVADWGNPNVVRASKGAVFAIQVAAARSPEVAEWLRSHHITIVAASPQSETLVTALDLSGSVAVIVGAEHSGLDEFWLAEADVAAALPMFGHVNSLNVAAAAAVIVYEAVRQRTR